MIIISSRVRNRIEMRLFFKKEVRKKGGGKEKEKRGEKKSYGFMMCVVNHD